MCKVEITKKFLQEGIDKRKHRIIPLLEEQSRLQIEIDKLQIEITEATSALETLGAQDGQIDKLQEAEATDTVPTVRDGAGAVKGQGAGIEKVVTGFRGKARSYLHDVLNDKDFKQISVAGIAEHFGVTDSTTSKYSSISTLLLEIYRENEDIYDYPRLNREGTGPGALRYLRKL